MAGRKDIFQHDNMFVLKGFFMDKKISSGNDGFGFEYDYASVDPTNVYPRFRRRSTISSSAFNPCS
jgi:hypothetical protein